MEDRPPGLASSNTQIASSDGQPPLTTDAPATNATSFDAHGRHLPTSHTIQASGSMPISNHQMADLRSRTADDGIHDVLTSGFFSGTPARASASRPTPPETTAADSLHSIQFSGQQLRTPLSAEEQQSAAALVDSDRRASSERRHRMNGF